MGIDLKYHCCTAAFEAHQVLPTFIFTNISFINVCTVDNLFKEKKTKVFMTFLISWVSRYLYKTIYCIFIKLKEGENVQEENDDKETKRFCCFLRHQGSYPSRQAGAVKQEK